MSGHKEKETITKKKLINEISLRKGVHPNEVRIVVQSFLDCVTQYLKAGDRLEFRDFGVFEVVTRKKKVGRNPKNASVPIFIPERRAVKFTPGKNMKSLIENSGSDSSSEEAQLETTV